MTLDKQHDTNPPSSNKSRTLLIIFCILLAAGLAIAIIRFSAPEARQNKATKQTAMLVDVIPLERGTYIPEISGLGTVEASRDVTLSPRVSGEITEISENFLPGGFVAQGETLVKIDPADYQNTLRQRKSELQQARADLSIEQGRRNAAEKEYELLKETLGAENEALVTRKPQLSAARAAVESAAAAVEQAELDLERTNIKAPFDAQILSRNVNLGSQVNAQTNLARLVGVDEYWIIVTVPISKIDRIAFPDDTQTGANAVIENRRAWPPDTQRIGTVRRLIGSLDNQTRLARILVSVQDPLARSTQSNAPRMIIGTIVQTKINGRPLDDVFRINRDYLRDNDTLWIKKNGKLNIMDVEVIFTDQQYAYIKSGPTAGDMLVTSTLATVAEGAPLRTEDESENAQHASPDMENAE